MEPSKDRLKEEKKETISSKYSIGTKAYNNINKRPNHNSTLSFSSRYKKNTNITSSQINKSKDKITNKYSTTNNNQISSNPFKSKNEGLSNTIKKYEYRSKNLSRLNKTSTKYDSSNRKGTTRVIRGKNDNLSFLVSGSSNKKSNTMRNNFKNKNNSLNFSNYIINPQKENKISGQTNIIENKSKLINQNDYLKNNTEKTSTSNYINISDSKYKKYNYTAKPKINIGLYNINNTNNISNISNINNINNNDNNNDNNIERKSYFTQSSPKKQIPKFEYKPKFNYIRKTFFETDINTNLTNNLTEDNNEKNDTNGNYLYPLITINNIKTEDLQPKPTISISTINNNEKRVYKTSTNKNSDEKNKNNYYEKIIEKYSNDNKKRNNTPNISSIRVRNRSTFHYTTSIKKPSQEKNTNTIRNNYISAIPHNKNNRYKRNTDIVGSSLNKTEVNYQPRNTLIETNLINNIRTSLNKSRYDFPEKPKIREYATKTEIHESNRDKYSTRTIVNNDRNRPEKEYEIINKYKSDFKKIENNRLHPRSISIPPTRFGKKYDLKTTVYSNRDRNYLRNNEYEVTDVNAYRRQQRLTENLSLDKNLPKTNEDTDKKVIEIKKPYTTFERSLINIKDNEKEIKKERERDNIRIRGTTSKNNAIFVSSNTSQNKRLYKTSTLREAYRPHGYSLGRLTEYEVQVPTYQKYNKIIESKNRFFDNNNTKINNVNQSTGLNTMNYYNTINNLRKENNADEDKEKEKVDYLLPSKLSIKTEFTPIENKNLYSVNLSSILRQDNNKNNYISNILDDKNKENKTIEDNKDIKLNNDINEKKEVKKSYIEIAREIINSSNNNTIPIPSYNNNTQTNKTYSYLDKYNYEKNKEKEKEKEKERDIIGKSININIQNLNQNLNINKIEESKPKSKLQINSQYILQKPISIQTEKEKEIKITYPKQTNTLQSTLKIQKEQKIIIPQQKQITNLKPQNQIVTQQLQEVHQQEEFLEDNARKLQENKNAYKNKKINENKAAEKNQNENIELRKSKYSSYFGDSNNNYYEIKGGTDSGDSDNEEEEEEEYEYENEKETDKIHKASKHSTFKIKSKKKKLPSEIDDKEEKEADEQIMEEVELNDINYGNNGENGEGEYVGEEHGNEEYVNNEIVEVEEIDDNILKRNNLKRRRY